MFVLPLLHLTQIFVQAIKALLPLFPVMLHPIRNPVQFIEPGFTVSFAALPRCDHQPALGKNLDVLGNSWATNVKILCNTVERKLLLRQQTQDGSPVRIGYCLENISSHVRYVTIRLLI
jgi:hypothetical protein